MLLGLSLVQFTALHVIISLIAISAGLVFSQHSRPAAGLAS